MNKVYIAYATELFVFAVGIVCSFVLARVVDSSIGVAEEGLYIEDAGFVAERSFDLFEATTSTPGLADALSFINVTNPEDFDALADKQASREGISLLGLVRRVDPSLVDSAATNISVIYNKTIDLVYITDRDVEGDLFVLEYVFPRMEAVLGLVVNSEESRAGAIETTVQTGETTFLDNVLLAPTGVLSRLAFYPIFSSVSQKIDSLLIMVVIYGEVFEPLATQFESTFPDSEVEFFVDGNKVLDSNPLTDLGDDNSMRFTSNEIDILVSEFNAPDYSDTFVYLFVSGAAIVTSLAVVVFLLNGSRVRAERFSSLKSRFIADISHEIRTPMNGILGMSELLSEMNLDETSRYYVKTISSCGDTLLALINDILDMSKIEAGLLDIREDTIRVQQVVKSTVESLWVAYSMKHESTRKQLELILEFEAGVPEKIVGDGFRIQQVLSNLLTNSLKFTDTGFIKIVVSCVEKGGKRYICVNVQDTGSGMTRDGVRDAFKAFKQVHSRTDVGGTGLGLSICRQLCGLMGGEIVCSSAVGVGTTVTFTVEANSVLDSEDPGNDRNTPPLRNVYKNGTIDVEGMNAKSASSVSDALGPIQTLEPQENSTHPKILVVDDVLINRKLLSRILLTVGIEAEMCDNGLQAVQMCDVCKYSLVLMDMVMPVMDGLEACAQIRSNNLNRETPVIFVSANVQSDSIAMCEKAGGSGFVTKPVKKAEIIEVFIRHCSPEEKEHTRRYLNETRV